MKQFTLPTRKVKILVANYRYEKMIAKSQAHLASIPVIHGYTRIYA